MPFDVIQEITKQYKIKLDLNTKSNFIVNEQSRNESQDTDDIKFSSKKITGVESKFISDFVCASYYDSNLHGEVNKDLFYIYKYNDTYKYLKEKPFEYEYMSYNTFLSEITNVEIINDNKDIMRKSIKLKRLSRRSTGVEATSENLYYIFDSPYGGLIDGSCYLFIELDGYTKPLDMLLKINGDTDAVIIDHLEGKIYIHNRYPDVIRNLYMYVDVAPLVIYQTGSYAPKAQEEVFGVFAQKGIEGLVDIHKLSDIDYIITFSFDAFIVSTDPYFISVDGITLLNPRFIPKKTPIYVSQVFSYKTESFLDDYYNLYLSKESTIDEKSGVHLNFNIEGIEDTGDLVSGLFVYEQESPSIINKKPNYIPLFKTLRTDEPIRED